MLFHSSTSTIWEILKTVFQSFYYFWQIWLVAVILISAKLLFYYLSKRKYKYLYERKQFFMTKSEREFFEILNSAVGGKYYIFPQVHLPTLFEHKIKGQDWRAAFSHISQKSVDFVLCDKGKISPLLAIELDDRSHERPDRIERDKEVERIFEISNLPLLRIKNGDRCDSVEIIQKINDAVGPKQ